MIEIFGHARNDNKKSPKLIQTSFGRIVTEFKSDIFTVILTKLLGYLQNIIPQGRYQNQFDGSDQSVIYPLTKEIPVKSTKKL